ncbi:C-signal-like isoform X4 [Melanerpes formicivorus]|uniref:C-signal-like isoform X4 n=1 Tax=Melanerpes formicivorus TaxID=211600 RepID=UPI00358ECF48
MGELRIHSVLVTGANRGIGLGFIQHFLGMPTPPKWVFAGCRDPKGQRAQELQNLASKHPNLLIVPLDVSNPASIKAAAAPVEKHLGGSGLTLLINNAGIATFNKLEDETLEDMTQVYTIDTIGPLLMGQALLPLLKKGAQGNPSSALSCSKAAIINISSSTASIASSSYWDMVQIVSSRCSKPPVTVDSSVQGMLNVLSSLSEKDTGTFLDWEGKVVPW